MKWEPPPANPGLFSVCERSGCSGLRGSAVMRSSESSVDWSEVS